MDSERTQYSAAAEAEHAESIRKMAMAAMGREVSADPESSGELAGCDLSPDTVREVTSAVLEAAGVSWALESVVASDSVPGVSHMRFTVAGLGMVELGYRSRDELVFHLETMCSRLRATAWLCPSCGMRVDVLGLVLDAKDGWRCACGTVFYGSGHVGRGDAPATADCWPTVAALLAGLEGGSGMPARSTVVACVAEGPVPVAQLFDGVSYRPAGASRDGAFVPVFAIAPDARVRDFADVHPPVQASLAAADRGLKGYGADASYGHLVFGEVVWVAEVAPDETSEKDVVELTLPFAADGRAEVVLSSSSASPVAGLTELLFDTVGSGPSGGTGDGGELDGAAVERSLDEARSRVASDLALELCPGPGWELSGGLPLSTEHNIEPDVALALRATEPLASFEDLDAARAWVDATLGLACSAFKRAEQELATAFKYTAARAG